MKKFIFLILILFVSIGFVFSEDVVLNTPYEKEISITIPENPEDMKDLIIQISELYWGERFDNEECDTDLEEALQQNDKLIIELEETKEQLGIANNTITDLQKELKKKCKNDPFRWGINILGGGVMKNDIISMSIKANPYIQLFEFVNIGAYFEYPIGIGLQLGVQFK